jgi:hypothetical protein
MLFSPPFKLKNGFCESQEEGAQHNRFHPPNGDHNKATLVPSPGIISGSCKARVHRAKSSHMLDQP